MMMVVNNASKAYFGSGNKSNLYQIFNAPVRVDNDVVSTASLFSLFPNFNSKVEIPDSVTSMSGMYSCCYNFNTPVTIGNNVTTISYLLNNCRNFNQPINMPDTVTYADNMLNNCWNFNAPIKFSTNLTYAISIFNNCHSFNCPVDLNQTNLTTANYMFYNCQNFNQPVNLPDTLSTAVSMFQQCINFNQPIDFGPNLTTANSAFLNCYNFNQPLNIYTINVTSMLMNCNNFNSALNINVSGNVASLLSNMGVNKQYNAPVTLGENVTDTSGLFYTYQNFNQPVIIPNNVHSTSSMFLDLFNYNQNVTLPVSRKIMNGNSMFSNCSNLHYVIGTINVGNGVDMFNNCVNLHFSSSPVTITGNCNNMFRNCELFNSEVHFDFSSSSSGTYANNVLTGCTNFDNHIYFNGYGYWISVLQGCVNFNHPIHWYSGNSSPTKSTFTSAANLPNFNSPIYVNYAPRGMSADILNIIPNEIRPVYNSPVTLYGCYSLANAFRNFYVFNKPFRPSIDTTYSYSTSNFTSMFENCYEFNQPIDMSSGGWLGNTQNLYVNNMFNNCRSLNAEITLYCNTNPWSSSLTPGHVYGAENLLWNCVSFNSTIRTNAVVSGMLNTWYDSSHPVTRFSSGNIIFTSYNASYRRQDSAIYMIWSTNNTQAPQVCGLNFNANVTFGPSTTVNLGQVWDTWFGTYNARNNYNATVSIGANMTNCYGGFRNFKNFNKSVTLPLNVTNAQYMFENCYNMFANIYIQGDFTSTTPLTGFLYGKNSTSLWSNSKRLNIITSYQNTANQLKSCAIFGNTSGSWKNGTNYYYNSRYNVYIYYPA